MINIRKLESELWESADLLRAGSKLTSNQYCMPVLGLIFLRYAYSRFKLVETEILKNRPSRGGRVLPIEASDFAAKSALYLPKEAQYEYLLNLPEDISVAGLKDKDDNDMKSLGEVVNNAMSLIEEQSEQLTGVLPNSYTDFSDEILSELLRIFNNSALDEVGGDVIGRIYEYFLNKFAKNIAKHIVAARGKSPIETTGQLTEIIRASIPMKYQKKSGHPAKRTFQAIRIELNRELEVLKNSLDDMIEILNPGGRLCIITFHSLEDRIVKSAFKKNENPCTCPPDFPVCVCGNVSKGRVVTRKPILPSEEELEYNSRSKSAKLRIFERS